jgi:hypothetical protein
VFILLIALLYTKVMQTIREYTGSPTRQPIFAL